MWVALLARGLSGVTAATWVSFSVLYSASYEADEIAPAVSRLMVAAVWLADRGHAAGRATGAARA